MRTRITALASLALASLTGTATAAGKGAAEHAAIAAYEGTKTCAGCHAQQVDEVVKSLHYQQQGPTPFLANAQQGKNAGMMVSF